MFWSSPDDIPEIGDDDSGSKGSRATGPDTRELTGVACERCMEFDGVHASDCPKRN